MNTYKPGELSMLALVRERDAAIARAEAAEVALTDLRAELDEEREKVRFPGLEEIAEREPWRVLREAADIIDALDRQPADTTPVLVDTSHGLNHWYALRAAADYLEAERQAAQAYEGLIEKAAKVIHESDCTSGVGLARTWDELSVPLRECYCDNARDLHAAGLLAEAGDDQ